MKLLETLQQVREPVAEAALVELTNLVDELPPSLEQFLRGSNGGVPLDRFLAIDTPWGGLVVTIDEFLPAAAAPGRPSILLHTSGLELGEMLPPTVLVLATLDHHGSALCISAEPDTRGAILFWDAERAHPEVADRSRIDHFAEFLAPVCATLDELAEQLADQATAEALRAGFPPPTEPPPVSVERVSEAPAYHPPVPLADAPANATLFLYQHRSGQPDTLYPKPLVAAADNTATPIEPDWVAPIVKWVRPDEGTVDMIDAGGRLVLRPKARDVIGSLLEQYGELLPLESDSGPLYLFRCLTLLDALAPHVQVETYPDGASTVSEHAFLPGAVATAGIFTVPQQPFDPTTFFHRSIVEQITNAEINVLDFSPTWPLDL